MADGRRVTFAAGAFTDLLLIEEHLIKDYRDFGESDTDAARHAAERIDAILIEAERLSTAPFRGEAHDDPLPGLRHLTLNRAIYWFLPDPEARETRVLAIFFGGQDHQRHMLVRLLRR
jgi:hypothetical protein